MREEEYSSKDLDHLGIVSAMCDPTFRGSRAAPRIFFSNQQI